MAHSLLAFIKAHGHVACIASPDHLDVLSVSYNTVGNWFEEWETIPATMPAVRAWLGY